MVSSGIYCILNLNTGDDYIGSSVDINRRFEEHKNRLRHNKHDNRHLQNSWNKHGEKKFLFFAVKEIENYKLIEEEQYFLDRENPTYNICKIAGAGPIIGAIETHKYSLSGNYIKSFQSIKEAARSVETNDGNIKLALDGVTRTAKGFCWSYDRVKCMPARDKYNRAKVNQYSLDGKFIKTWETIREAAKHHNVDPASISKCCSGKYDSAGKYLWAYKKDNYNRLPVYERNQAYKAISKYDTFGNLVKMYRSINEAADDVGCSYSSLWNAIKGNWKTAKGFTWRLV
jgi:hypothetical protein